MGSISVGIHRIQIFGNSFDLEIILGVKACWFGFQAELVKRLVDHHLLLINAGLELEIVMHEDKTSESEYENNEKVPDGSRRRRCEIPSNGQARKIPETDQDQNKNIGNCHNNLNLFSDLLNDFDGSNDMFSKCQ